jgi:diguanylate cyclase (GGDEF)-like protein
VAPPASAILASLTCFAAATAEISTFLPGIVLALGILWVNVLVPLRFRDALMFTMLLLTLGAAINIVSAVRRHAAIENADVIVITLFLVALSLLARLLAERDLRGSFVLGLKLQARAEDLARSNQTLQEMSNTDPLTGLANRRSFDISLSQAWQTAATARSCIAMLMIDVDHFKLFNDTAGHLEGDRCLGAVARAIADHVRRGNDLAARFGGEEFVVLMPATDQDEAHEIAERIRIAIAALRVFHPARIGRGFVSVSIGVAAMTPGAPGVTSTALLAAADDAMYAAKTAGRDRVMRAERPLPAAPDVRMDIGRFACP